MVRYTNKKFDKSLYGNLGGLKDFLIEFSDKFATMIELKKGGEGGESFVYIADMPGRNVVMKAPKN